MLKVFRAHLGPEPSQPRFPGTIDQQAQGHPDPWGETGTAPEVVAGALSCCRHSRPL